MVGFYLIIVFFVPRGSGHLRACHLPASLFTSGSGRPALPGRRVSSGFEMELQKSCLCLLCAGEPRSDPSDVQIAPALGKTEVLQKIMGQRRGSPGLTGIFSLKLPFLTVGAMEKLGLTLPSPNKVQLLGKRRQKSPVLPGATCRRCSARAGLVFLV